VADKRDIAGTTLTIARNEILAARGNRSVAEFTLPTLRVVAGPDMLKFASIYPGEKVVIGRDDTCELTLTEVSVSRRHAIIHSSDEGQLSLEDLGSTNGTSYNGKKVTSSIDIEAGAQLQVGGVTMRIESLGLNELAHLSKVVERLTLANKDALTGLVTRFYLDDELPNLVMRHELAEVPLSAVFLDVDHFGAVNKKFLHDVGDEVLRAVARLMVMHVREADTCVRYGGEEFLAVLPNCGEQGAFRTAERLRQEIESHDWSHYAEGLSITVSLGIAQHIVREETRDWLRRADGAMNEAKNRGRNQTLCWSKLS